MGHKTVDSMGYVMQEPTISAISRWLPAPFHCYFSLSGLHSSLSLQHWMGVRREWRVFIVTWQNNFGLDFNTLIIKRRGLPQSF